MAKAQCQVGASLPEGTDSHQVANSHQVGLFLDLLNPAQCGGTAKAWKFCYHGRVNQRPVLAVGLLIYRQLNVTERQSYILVSSKTNVRNSMEMISSGFHCENIALEESEVFDIHKGDVIGACLQNSEGLGSIGVIGDLSPDRDETSQLHKAVANEGSCLLTDINTVVVETDLLPLTRSVLHLSIITGDKGKLS